MLHYSVVLCNIVCVVLFCAVLRDIILLFEMQFVFSFFLFLLLYHEKSRNRYLLNISHLINPADHLLDKSLVSHPFIISSFSSSYPSDSTFATTMDAISPFVKICNTKRLATPSKTYIEV